MAMLTSSQLQQILDVNAKSVEIYLEVNNQYDSIIKDLDELKNKNSNHITHSERAIEKIEEKVKAIEDKIKDSCTGITSKDDKILESINKIEKAISKQNWILTSSLATLIIAIIAKLLGIHIP